MSNLFSAVFPPPQVVGSLRAELDRLAVGNAASSGVRWADPDRWHVTLAFYGEDDPDDRAGWLRDRLAGRAAPTLRLAGAGSFAHVLYLGVYGEGLTELATVAGAGGDRPYLPHLTLARTTEEVPPELPRRLSSIASEEWTATEVLLMRSEHDSAAGQSRYTVVERFPLRSGDSAT